MKKSVSERTESIQFTLRHKIIEVGSHTWTPTWDGTQTVVDRKTAPVMRIVRNTLNDLIYKQSKRFGG